MPTCEERGGKAGHGAADIKRCLRPAHGPVDHSGQRTHQHAGHKALHKHQEWIDIDQGRTQRTGTADAEALQEADQAERTADDQAARHTHRHDRNSDRDHVKGDRQAHGHRNVYESQDNQNSHQHGQQRHLRDPCAPCYFVCHKNPSVRVPSGYPSKCIFALILASGAYCCRRSTHADDKHYTGF